MKLRRWFANFFLLAGVLAILFSAGAIATAVVWQDWQNWVFDRESRNEPATISGYIAGKKDRAIEIVREWRGLPSGPKPSTVHPGTAPEPERPRAIAKNEILGRLTIQRLHLSAMVREGDEENTLSLALGHIPGTALPGQTGNVGIAGHRDTLFRGLRNVRKDDLIQFETLAGTHMYKVGSIEIVKPQDVGVLDPGRNPELTLVTCYPFYYVGSAPDRFIVKAQEVSTESAARPVEEPPATAHKETVAFSREPDERRPASGKISFNVSVGHSRQLAPRNISRRDGNGPGLHSACQGLDVAHARPPHHLAAKSERGRSRGVLRLCGRQEARSADHEHFEDFGDGVSDVAGRINRPLRLASHLQAETSRDAELKEHRNSNHLAAHRRLGGGKCGGSQARNAGRMAGLHTECASPAPGESDCARSFPSGGQKCRNERQAPTPGDVIVAPACTTPTPGAVGADSTIGPHPSSFPAFPSRMFSLSSAVTVSTSNSISNSSQ